MIAGIADIIILALVLGYCGYIICRKHQDKKSGKGGCAGCSGCSGSCAGCSASLYQKKK